MPDDADRLPEAHPRFSRHFANPIYDPGRDDNDDVPPFGTDEGSDELHDWAERLDVLGLRPTLRHLLGEDADAQIEELRRSSQVDVDDIVIGLGFALLRFTGQIDDEGRGWLIEALERQDERGGGPEYAQMLGDLATFDPPGNDSARAEAPKSRKTGPWLTITGSNDDELEAWYQRTARALAADPSWTAWWRSSGLDRLVLYPSPIGPPGRDHTAFDQKKSWLHVVGSSAELSGISWAWLEAEEAGQDVPLSVVQSPRGTALIIALTYRLLAETGEHLGIGPPPSHLPG